MSRVLRQWLVACLQRLAGTLRRARMRLASRIVSFGVSLHVWIADLGFWLGPELARLPGRSPNPWPGILVVILLALGLAAASGGAVWLIDAGLPHRETRQ